MANSNDSVAVSAHGAMKSQAVSGRAMPARRPMLAVGAVIALLALPVLPVPEFWITQLNTIGMYALVALGLVLLTGVGGLTSFGQSAFAGIAAYSTAYVTTKLGWSAWAGLVLGVGLAGCAALLLGALTLRMSGHYLPLATIAWCLALYYAMGNIEALGKYDGLLGVPPITLFGYDLQGGRRMYYLIWGAALVAAVALRCLLDSRPGRVMRALNGSNGGGSVMPEAMGASAFRHKLAMFVIAAVLAAVSGWLFAHLQRAVNPSPFGIKYGIEYLFMAVLGGVGSVGGAFAGAAMVKLTEDQLQVWMPRLLGTSGNVEVIVFGVVLVLLLKWAPAGLWPTLTRLGAARPRVHDWRAAVALSRRVQPAFGALVLEVRGLCKTFGGLKAVDGVSFSVHAGEIVGLIGPNGAGKSTTFHLVSGVLRMSAGEVRLLGQPVGALPSRAVARRGLSRTFQHAKLVPEMSVLENVMLGAYLRTSTGSLAAMLRRDRGEERRLRHEAQLQLERLGLAQHRDALAGNLALGQQRLVEIARALASDPVLLLLDEPAAGLRYQEKQQLAQVLCRLKADGLSLLLVEHDMELVMKISDRIVVMESGRKLMEGDPRQVQGSSAVRAAYLGVEG